MMGRSRQSGFTYLGILIAIIIAEVLLAEAGVNWSQIAKRDRETELLFVGDQFRQAIALYYERTPGAIKRYPQKLDDLVEDRRYNPPQRYLRKVYIDPVTNRAEWGLVMAPEGGIMGVHSLSDGIPLKRAGFSDTDHAFEKAKTYADWIFLYTPTPVVAQGAPF